MWRCLADTFHKYVATRKCSPVSSYTVTVDRYRKVLQLAQSINWLSWLPSLWHTIVKIYPTKYSCKSAVPCTAVDTGIILGMGSANEKRGFIVKSSLIGWAHAQNGHSVLYHFVSDCCTPCTYTFSAFFHWSLTITELPTFQLNNPEWYCNNRMVPYHNKHPSPCIVCRILVYAIYVIFCGDTFEI